MLQCARGAPHPELFSDYNSRPCVLFIDGRLYHANTSVTFDRQHGCLFFLSLHSCPISVSVMLIYCYL